MSDVAHWDERYRTGNVPWDTRKPSSELVRVIGEDAVAPCRAIDLGCGTGTNAIWLSQQGFDVTGVDFSPRAIEQARQAAKAADINIRLLAGDVTALPDLGAPFAFVFDRGCYHIIRQANLEGYLQALERLTQPGSRALILTGNAREPMDPGPPVVSEEQIQAELGRLFDVVRLREFRFDESPMVPNRPLAWSCWLRRR